MLSNDLPATRLLCVEILAADLEGTERFRALIESLVARLRDGIGPGSPAGSPNAARGALVFIAFQVGSMAVKADPDAILDFEDDFTAMIRHALVG